MQNTTDDDFGLPDINYDPVDRQQTETRQPKAKKVEKKTKTSGNSQVPIIIGIVIFLLLAVGVYYAFVYRPGQLIKEAQIEAQAEQDRINAEQAENARQAELDAEALANEEAALAEQERLANQQPTTGTSTVLKSRTGKSYLVVASFFDGDMAQDYSNKLVAQGVSPYIIEPYNDTRFYRVAIQSYDTFSEGLNSVENFTGEYGNQVWVLKY